MTYTIQSEIYNKLNDKLRKSDRPVKESEIFSIETPYCAHSDGTGIFSRKNPVYKAIGKERRTHPGFIYTVSTVKRTKKKVYNRRYFEYEGTITIAAPVSVIRAVWCTTTLYEFKQKYKARCEELLHAAAPLAQQLEHTPLAEKMFHCVAYYDFYSIEINTSGFSSACDRGGSFSAMGYKLTSPLAPVAVGIVYKKFLQKKLGAEYTVEVLPNETGDKCKVHIIKRPKPQSEPPLYII